MLIGVVGWVTNALVSKEIKQLTRYKLEAILDTDVAALQQWYHNAEALVEAIGHART